MMQSEIAMEKKMRNRIAGVLLILLIISGASASRAEEAVAPAATGSVSLLSKYMWRGYELSNDSVVAQPSMTISYKGLAFNAWANLDTDPADEAAALNETDLTVSYDKSIGSFGLGAGYIYYGLDGMEDTQEFYLKASYATMLTPTLTMYKDISSLPGYYLSLGLSQAIALSDSISLSLSGAFGYYISSDDAILEAGTSDKYNGLQDGILSASITMPVTEYITVTPTVSYAFPLSDKAEDSLGITDGTMYGGLVLSFAF
jgi:hypothetical protein